MNKNKKLYKEYLKHRNSKAAEDRYKNYNRQLKRIKRAANKRYYNDICEVNKNNGKKLWKTINKVVHQTNNKTEVIEKLKINGIEEHRDQEIVEEFAKHFATIGEKYANQMPGSKQSINTYLNKIPNHNESIFLEPCTEQEIDKLISSLQPKRSSGTDNIDNVILKRDPESLDITPHANLQQVP